MDFLTFMQKNWTWMTGCAGLIVGVVVYVYSRLKRYNWAFRRCSERR